MCLAVCVPCGVWCACLAVYVAGRPGGLVVNLEHYSQGWSRGLKSLVFYVPDIRAISLSSARVSTAVGRKSKREESVTLFSR